MKKQEEKRLSVRLPEYYFQALEHSRKKLKLESISEVVRMLLGFYILNEIQGFENEDIGMVTSGDKETDMDSFRKLMEKYYQRFNEYMEYLEDTKEKAEETISFADSQIERIKNGMRNEPFFEVVGYIKDYEIRQGVAHEKQT